MSWHLSFNLLSVTEKQRRTFFISQLANWRVQPNVQPQFGRTRVQTRTATNATCQSRVYNCSVTCTLRSQCLKWLLFISQGPRTLDCGLVPWPSVCTVCCCCRFEACAFCAVWQMSAVPNVWVSLPFCKKWQIKKKIFHTLSKTGFAVSLHILFTPEAMHLIFCSVRMKTFIDAFVPRDMYPSYFCHSNMKPRQRVGATPPDKGIMSVECKRGNATDATDLVFSVLHVSELTCLGLQLLITVVMRVIMDG